MRTANAISGAWRISKPSDGRQRGQARFQAIGGHHQAGETDSFLWSLADLMTLLLVFFIMLYANAAVQLPVGSAETKQRGHLTAIGDPGSERSEFASHSPAIPAGPGKADAPQPKQSADPEETGSAALPHEMAPSDETANQPVFAELADGFSKDFYMRWENRQPVIVLGERITFNAGEAGLLTEARSALARVARTINRIHVNKVIVTGHTDDRPIHTAAFPSNWELSAARAASVAKALMDDGVSAGRLVIQGQAQFNALVPNTTEENRRRNRRVEIVLVTD